MTAGVTVIKKEIFMTRDTGIVNRQGGIFQTLLKENWYFSEAWISQDLILW